jgi:cation diffusion facilitator CzcD-associated flavoprotein CzcO
VLPVVVVGAGPAGLAVASALSSRDLESVVLDRHTAVGGLWDTTNPETACRDDVELVTSSSQTGYTNVPLNSQVDYPSQAEVLTYLRDFAQQRLGMAQLRLGVGADSYCSDSDGRWRIRLSTGDVLRAESLVICTGLYRQPHIPEGIYPDLQKHNWVHSKEYRPAQISPGDKVCVVGGGNSASDVAVSAYRAGAEVWLKWRSTPWFIPSYVGGRPIDTIEPLLAGVPRQLHGREVQRQLAAHAFLGRFIAFCFTVRRSYNPR